jgi:hypothetical protein
MSFCRCFLEAIKRSVLIMSNRYQTIFHMGREVSVGWFWQQQTPAIFRSFYWFRYHTELLSEYLMVCYIRLLYFAVAHWWLLHRIDITL